MQDWLFNELLKLNGPNMDFFSKVERKCYADLEHFGPCDAFVPAVMLFPECIRKKYDCHATVELHGRETRGQMCIGHVSTEKPNVTVIEYLHEDAVKKALIYTADATDTL